MAKKSDILSLMTFDPEYDAYIESLEDDARLAAAADDPECSFDEIMEMVAGNRTIPFCTNMSAETAYRVTQHLARAA